MAGWKLILRWSPALLLALFTVACAAGAPAAGAPAAGTPAVAGVTTGPTAGSPAVEQQVQRAIDEFNRTAGGSVQAQQAVLTKLVSAGQVTVQEKCARATNTIRFEPVYDRLTLAPDWKPASGTLPGQVYQLPTLIRIYSGDRITGTDLTDLHLSVEAGQVRLPALCLS